ncbi:hypothetical protein CLOM_g20029, partial [Closterium sp. NIES-68]
LPYTLARLTKLKELYLRNNGFKGRLPDFIGGLTNLEKLMVSKNNWEGPIPTFLSKLKKLKYLGLRETAFEGNIPTFLATLDKLTYLSLSETRLSGEVPKALNALVSLKELYINSAWFYGPLPNLSSLKKLTLIDLADKFFSGPVPSFLLRVPVVSMGGNYFSGSATALPCADHFTLVGNCLSAGPTKCGGPAAQKTTAECNKFCGTAMAAGACSGKGVCMPDVEKIPSADAFAPICKCEKGYWASHKKLRCSNNNT